MNDNVNESGMPQVPEPPVEDLDAISNKGQRVAALLIAVLVVAGAVAGFVMYANKQAQADAYDKLKADFAVLDANGYRQFWKVAKLDLDTMKTNVDFAAKIKEYLDVSAVAYAKHLKEKAIPVLEKAIPNYRALEARGMLVPEIKALYHALDNLLMTWRRFADEVLLYEQFLDNLSKLDDASSAWVGAQWNPKKEEYTAKAARYLALVNCILGDKMAHEYDPVDLRYRIKDTCAKADGRSDWFRKVAFTCMESLSKDVEADALYQQTLAKYAKEDPANQDTKSVFGIKECLKLARDTFESDWATAIVEQWAAYAKAKNNFLKAWKEAKDAL